MRKLTIPIEVVNRTGWPIDVDARLDGGRLVVSLTENRGDLAWEQPDGAEERLEMRSALTPAEAFKALGLSRSYGYKLLAEGRLRSIKLGRKKILITRADIERFLHEGPQE